MSLARHADESGLSLRSSVPMLAVGPALEIVLLNEAAEGLLGLEEREVLGKPCWEVLGCPSWTQRCCAVHEDAQALGSAECAPAFESELSTGSGERVWVSVTTILAAAGHEAPLRVHLLHELRRQRQLEELLRHVVSTASKVSSPAEPVENDGLGSRTRPSLRGVTEREREVVRLLAQGRSTAQIAAQLGISPRTIRNHVQNILCKLHVHSRLEAVASASARGLL
jgi:DNA-binding CsgD family transcriptional regulator